MESPPKFDLATAHHFFAASCFNHTWIHLEKAERSAADLEEMRSLAHASLWHWQQRKDCTARNLSIAYWLLSRTYAVLSCGADAAEYGLRSLKQAVNEPPYFTGYAREALARAALLNRDYAGVTENLRLALECVALVRDEEGHRRLTADLDQIARQMASISQA